MGDFVNHRSLADERPAEELRSQQDAIDRLQNTIDGLQKQHSLFAHEGWKAIQSRLYEELNNAYFKLKGDSVTSMEGVARLRGEIAALERLMVMDEAIKIELDLAKDQMKGLTSGMTVNP